MHIRVHNDNEGWQFKVKGQWWALLQHSTHAYIMVLLCQWCNQSRTNLKEFHGEVSGMLRGGVRFLLHLSTQFFLCRVYTLEIQQVVLVVYLVELEVQLHHQARCHLSVPVCAKHSLSNHQTHKYKIQNIARAQTNPHNPPASDEIRSDYLPLEIQCLELS